MDMTLERKIFLFFRDDDIAELNEKLVKLLDIFISHKVPIHLAVIPQKMTAECRDYLLDMTNKHGNLIEIGQHGFSHADHSGSKDKFFKYEFGEARSYQQQHTDIREGRAILEKNFNRTIDIFTPPWHGLDQNTLKVLSEQGFSIISSGRRREKIDYHGIEDVSIKIDFNKVNGDGQWFAVDNAGIIKGVVGAGDLKVGILLHHDKFNGQDEFDQLDQLLRLIKKINFMEFIFLSERVRPETSESVARQSIKAVQFLPDFKLKRHVAFLRFSLDTLGQNFIYEEAECFKKYSPVVFCGNVKRLDRKVNYYCHREFMKLYQPEWPEFSESHEEVYHKGMARYLDLITKLRVKLLHAQFLTDAFFCFSLIKDCRIPLIVNLRGYDLFHPKIKLFLSRVLPFVSKFVVKSESMKEALASYGCGPEKIDVVYGGINTGKILFKPRAPLEKNIKILSAGRFVDKKGYDVTLKFFKQLLKKYPDAKLTLIGEGKLKGELMKLIDSFGIGANVDIKGYMEHGSFIKELYNHNLFVLPSRTAENGDQEGIPNVLKEAMASGMPVISTYHSGIPELIADQKTGYLVQENDYSGMVEKLNFILGNGEKVLEVCSNARFFVEQNFNIKESAAQIERLYNDFI